MAKINLGKTSNYTEKVQSHLQEMLQTDVKVTRSDSEFKVHFPSHNFTYAINLYSYWQFAKGQNPGYVAQYLVQNYVPHNMGKGTNAWDKWCENNNPFQAKPQPTLDPGIYTAPLVAGTYANSITSGYIKAGHIESGPVYYSNHTNWKAAPKPKIQIDPVNTNLQHLMQAFTAMQEAFKKQGEAMAKIATELQPALDEMAKQFKIKQKVFLEEKLANYPQYAVTNHPGLNKRAQCPKCTRNADLCHIIQHMNDEHEMEREKIADWLDTLDEQPMFYPDVQIEA